MSVSYPELLRVYGRIGLLSFGGPAAQIALMHKELVEERAWLSEREFLSALSFCMLLPGPEAMQLATYAGWKTRGLAGGLIAGGLFVLPGAIVIFALALLYASFGAQPLVQVAFLGIKAAIVVIVLQALLKVARKALKGPLAWGIAGLSFAALYGFQVPFPLVILGAALMGAGTGQTAAMRTAIALPDWRPSARIALWGGVVWALPVAVLALTGQTLLLEVGVFFSKLAVVTFGGAYAVLAYMTQTVVQDYGWLSTAQMIDALGLAETTPGPLILVTQFVAVLTGALQGGWPLALAAGMVALWVTFVPCFIWIFAGAPYLEWVTSLPRLRAAMDAITAAVVGVIANLTLWFALHVFFAQTTLLDHGAGSVLLPVWGTVDATALALGLVAAGLMLGLGWPMVRTLALTCLLALVTTAF